MHFAYNIAQKVIYILILTVFFHLLFYSLKKIKTVFIMRYYSFMDNAVADVKKILDKNPVKQISSSVENLLKTGRLITQTGLDLQQVLTYW